MERAAGATLFVSGAALLIWARRINPFFIPVIREPRWIVEEGPYRWLRHPGYAGFVLMAEGSFLALGHWIGVFPLVAYLVFLVARARRENRILYERSGKRVVKKCL
jgi:protein-S-isoprenylcysteine O-methyltransferase Ste14